MGRPRASAAEVGPSLLSPDPGHSAKRQNLPRFRQTDRLGTVVVREVELLKLLGFTRLRHLLELELVGL